ncbi:MAG: D-alanyl-D-alanine carboxypeptidase family protein [Lachnospiraceae bacterium]|jgi:D-alanyl-D-alanine carboxypeptidase (penicillin-binding protein 5/6)
MKAVRKLAAVCICSALLLTGCGQGEKFLKPYAQASSDEVSTADMLDADAFKGFAEDLGVVSVSDSENGVGGSVLDDINGNEVFLTGTDDGEVICASNVFEEVAPASTTKLMTALCALKSGIDFDTEVTMGDEVTISDPDAQLCGFQSGDKATFGTLLNAMLVYSGNDAANAIAVAVAGDLDSFCDQMNEEAAKIGATHSHFLSPNGLDMDGHYSTAYDMYLILQACLQYDSFKEIIQQGEYTGTYTRGDLTMKTTWEATDEYLSGEAEEPSGIKVFGGKTGSTDNAGKCLVLYAEDTDENGYIAVIMGSENSSTLYKSMTKLLSAINSNDTGSSSSGAKETSSSSDSSEQETSSSSGSSEQETESE